MDTDLGSLSLALMAKGIGFLLGSLLAGLVLDIINREFFFCLTTCTLAISAALAPSGTIYGFIVCMFITGGMGSIIAAGEQYCTRLETSFTLLLRSQFVTNN